MFLCRYEALRDRKQALTERRETEKKRSGWHLSCLGYSPVLTQWVAGLVRQKACYGSIHRNTRSPLIAPGVSTLGSPVSMAGGSRVNKPFEEKILFSLQLLLLRLEVLVSYASYRGEILLFHTRTFEAVYTPEQMPGHSWKGVSYPGQQSWDKEDGFFLFPSLTEEAGTPPRVCLITYTKTFLSGRSCARFQCVRR